MWGVGEAEEDKHGKYQIVAEEADVDLGPHLPHGLEDSLMWTSFS
jgi:hypothetical protein